jgi:hypothetical protein
MTIEKSAPDKDLGAKAATQAILLVTARPSDMLPFSRELRDASRLRMVVARSVGEAIDAAKRYPVVMAVVDDLICESGGLDLIRHLIQIDAFIHTAVLSDADEATFHDRSEGLGVLAKLSLMPGQKDARHLWESLRGILKHHDATLEPLGEILCR